MHIIFQIKTQIINDYRFVTWKQQIKIIFQKQWI